MRLHHSQAWFLALALTAATTPAPASAKKVALRLGIPAGETLHYRMDLEQEVNIQGMVITVTEGGNVDIVALESPSDTLQFSVLFRDFQGFCLPVDFPCKRRVKHRKLCRRFSLYHM